MLHNAVICAAFAHMGRDRKDSPLPYVTHCFDVMKRLSLWGERDEDLLAAALLHDTIEDTHTESATIAAVAGPVALALVEAVTWSASIGSARTKFEALCELAAKVEETGADLNAVRLLKMADRFCNVCDFDHTAEMTGGTDPYPSRYALLGYPVFHAWLQEGRRPRAAQMGRDLALYESIIQRHYPDFRLNETPIDTARTWLFAKER